MITKFVDKIAKSVATESNFFKGAFLANLRKTLNTNKDAYTCKESSIAVYQKIYE